MAGKAEPRQPRQSQESGINAAVVQFLETRCDTAAQGDDFQVGTQMQGLGLAAQAGGADHRARRQVFQGFSLVRNESVARVFPGRHRRQHNSVRQPRRHILHRMHRRIDAPVQQGFVQFLGEQALAAGVLQPLVQKPVAAGDKALHGKIRIAHSRGMRQQPRHHMALGQGQR